MTALGGSEVEATVSAVSGYTAGLPRLQAADSRSQDRGDLVETFGGGHMIGMEGVVHGVRRASEFGVPRKNAEFDQRLGQALDALIV